MAININVRTANIITRTPAVTAFLNNIRNFAPMTIDEEVEAFTALQNGDESQKEKIANSNMLFAFSLASKYAKGDAILDYTNAAVIGMYRAMETFDLTRGILFRSYAIHYMYLEIRKEFMLVEPLVRKSNAMLISPKVNKVRNEFLATEQREPTEEELIDVLNRVYGIEVKNKLDVLDCKQSSLSDKIDEDGAEASEVGEIAMSTASYNEYEREMEQEDAEDKTAKCLAILPVRDRQIVKMFFGIGCDAMDLDTIGEKMGMTGERCRQIKESALKRMRESAKVKKLLRA